MDAASVFKGLVPELSGACEPLLLRLPRQPQALAAGPSGAERPNGGDGASGQPGSARGRICSQLLAAALQGAAALTQGPECQTGPPVRPGEPSGVRPLKRQRLPDKLVPECASQACQGQLSVSSQGAGGRGVTGDTPHPGDVTLQAELLRGKGRAGAEGHGWGWQGVEERAEVAREIAWEALHGGPWRGVPMDWRDAHALSCWLLAFAQVIQASPGAAEGALRHLDMALLLGSSGVLQESIRTCIACLQQGSPRLPPQGPHGAQGQDGRPDQPQKKDGRQHGNANEEPTGRGGEMDGSGVDKERCTEARGSIVDHQQLQANEVQASSWAARPPGDRLEGLRAPSELGDSLRGARSGSERPSQSNGAEAPGLPDGAFGCWAVERRALPSLEEFLRDFMLPATPVVVTRAMAHWPALERWRDTAYLERVAGRRTVPVEVGSHYLDEAWTQELMTLSAFIARHLPRPGPPPSCQVPASTGAQGEPEGVRESVARGDRERVEEEGGRKRREETAPRGPVDESVSRSVTPIGYLAQHPLFEQIPELRGDIAVPEYCVLQPPRKGMSKAETMEHRAASTGGPLVATLSPLSREEDGAPVEPERLGEGQGEEGALMEGEAEEEDEEDEEGGEVKMNAWFGPRGTVTPLHHDPYHNLLAQVVGKKYVRIYKAEEARRLYPHTETMLQNASQVDLDKVDHSKFPLFKGAPFWDCILDQGEMLYIPPRFWHYVRSLSLSFSVSFWWE